MDKISVMQIQQEMLEKMAQHTTIATNPLSVPTESMLSPSALGKVSESAVTNNSLQFGRALKGVLDTVNTYQQHAAERVTAVELGHSDDLLGATIASQKAGLSFNALMQVRNKMVSNFESIIKMPI
ncbi:flagellar hook-basal body complex protein FliE [Vibrio sp. 10N]|uniref:flagellar hook-basal body complex protein FliE n=1 Tax=Vibrio sp. 10N TaxID=3058938 RepID=UPI0028132318|nr:flagellar hook-basal body complex protein FliE [Vibrio sp. 10N]